jgi:S-adenosylmethionine hydrolase
MRIRRTLMILAAATLGVWAVACTPPWARFGAEPTLLPAVVVYISEEYANINTDLSGEILSAHGIVNKATFKFRSGDQTLRARLGMSYADVLRGEWIGQIEEDGNLQLAISYGHAATELGCAVGDTLYVLASRITDP